MLYGFIECDTKPLGRFFFHVPEDIPVFAVIVSDTFTVFICYGYLNVRRPFVQVAVDDVFYFIVQSLSTVKTCKVC